MQQRDESVDRPPTNVHCSCPQGQVWTSSSNGVVNQCGSIAAAQLHTACTTAAAPRATAAEHTTVGLQGNRAGATHPGQTGRAHQQGNKATENGATRTTHPGRKSLGPWWCRVGAAPTVRRPAAQRHQGERAAQHVIATPHFACNRSARLHRCCRPSPHAASSCRCVPAKNRRKKQQKGKTENTSRQINV